MKLPADVHGTDAVKALRRLGFTTDHQTGSHHIMRGSDGRIVVVLILGTETRSPRYFYARLRPGH